MTRNIFLALCICTTATLRAQQPDKEILVHEVFRKTPLSKALKTIQSNYPVRIAFDHALVQNILVALELQDLSVSQSMEQLLAGTPLTFQTIGNNIVIVPRPRDEWKDSPREISASVSGTVRDADTGETLPQATLRIRGTAIATTANNDGHFTLFKIPADTCVLEVMYVGYITQSRRVRDINMHEPLDLWLRSDTQMLHEVVVLDEYNQAVHVEELPGASVFNPASLSSLPSLGEQDIFRTMQLVPGVAATDESSAGMVIRGSHPSYNLTLLDGMTIYQQDHFFGSFSIINADIIKDVRVYKGMFDARYGGRVSGLVDITSKDGNAVKPSFSAKVNLISAKATAEIPLGKKWSLFAGARRSFTDVVQTSLFNTLFDVARASSDQIQFFRPQALTGHATPTYYFFDANTKLTFRPTTCDKISLSLYASRDQIHIRDSASLGDDTDTFIVTRDETTHWGNNGISLRWSRQWNEQYYSSLRVSGSEFFRNFNLHQQIDLDMMRSTYRFDLENNITDFSYALDNEWVLNTTLSWTFGISGTRQKTHARIRDGYTYTVSGDVDPGEMPGDTDAAEDNQSWLHSVYGMLKASPVNRLTVSAGARVVHYYNRVGQQYIEPRLSARYALTQDMNLKTGYGRSNQFITQLFYYSPTGSISGMNENFWMLSEPGDPRYPVITSDHVTAGVTQKHGQFIYDAEVYYKTTRGVIIDDNFADGTADTHGMDIMIQKTRGIHKGWLAYSFARGTQTHPDILGGQAMPSWQDQRHEIKLVDMVTLGRWNISSTVLYGSGKPYAKYLVQYHRDEETGTIDSYDLALDYRNKTRLPAYFRIDLAVSYRTHIKTSVVLETGLSIHNITDHRNIKTRRIDTARIEQAIFAGEELPPTYIDLVLPGLSPSLFLNIGF